MTTQRATWRVYRPLQPEALPDAPAFRYVLLALDSSVVFVGSRRIAFRTAITQTEPVRDIITRQRPKHLDSESASLMQYSDGSLPYFELAKTFNQASPSRSETISRFSLCRCAKKTFPDSHLLICKLPSLHGGHQLPWM